MKPHRALRAWMAVLLSCSATGGCVAAHPAHPYDQGWRLARIARLGPELPAPGTHAHDCRVTAAYRSGAAAARYVEVWFVEIRDVQIHTVRLPPQAEAFHDGDFVYINVRDCTLPAAIAD